MKTPEWNALSYIEKNRIIAETFGMLPEKTTFTVVSDDSRLYDSGYQVREYAQLRADNYLKHEKVGCQVVQFDQYAEYSKSLELLIKLAVDNRIEINLDTDFKGDVVSYNVYVNYHKPPYSSVEVVDNTSMVDVLSRALLRIKGVIVE
jgi:hypothetical protein